MRLATFPNISGVAIPPIAAAPTIQALDSAQTIATAAVVSAGGGDYPKGFYIRQGLTIERSDTLPTAALIVASLRSSFGLTTVGQAWLFTVVNLTSFGLTLLIGTGDTISGDAVVDSDTQAVFLVTTTNVTAGSQAVTFTRLLSNPADV